MTEDNSDEQIGKWLAGELSEEELKAAIGAENVLKYKQILSEIDRWTPDNTVELPGVEEITGLPKKKKAKQANMWLPFSVAASVVVLMAAVVWLVLVREKTTHATVAGEIKEVLLPDGKSTVTLAAGSAVSWTEKSWAGGRRQLTLTGKGFLQVEGGSPFMVNTASGSVEVLGTTFEVSVFEEGLQVQCYEGTVQATAQNGQTVKINRGESYLHYGGQWEEKGNLSSNEPAWFGSESAFSNAPLKQVVSALAAEYGLEISTGSVNLSRRFTGSFPNHNLPAALKIVFDPLGISYELKDHRLYLLE